MKINILQQKYTSIGSVYQLAYPWISEIVLFSQLVHFLREAGELSLLTAFGDGTKLETNASRYSFVWKKTVEKNQEKMQKKMKAELPKLVAQFDVRFRVGDKVLCRIRDSALVQRPEKAAEETLCSQGGHTICPW
ncbi:MAG: hypothetical protein DDT20_01625 [Firmicutes bacterium]|nr:hypothetical protein [Bacillota bacterium]